MRFDNFTPYADSTTITAGTTTAATSLGSTRNRNQVLIYNSLSEIVFVKLGDSTVEATVAAGMPIPAGGWVTINAEQNTHIATITTSGTGSVYITPGYGT